MVHSENCIYLWTLELKIIGSLQHDVNYEVEPGVSSFFLTPQCRFEASNRLTKPDVISKMLDAARPVRKNAHAVSRHEIISGLRAGLLTQVHGSARCCGHQSTNL